jgi:hypothetical protein
MKITPGSDLSKQSKAELAETAQRLGIPSAGKSKQQLIKDILSSKSSRSKNSAKDLPNTAGKGGKPLKKTNITPRQSAGLKRAKTNPGLEGQRKGAGRPNKKGGIEPQIGQPKSVSSKKAVKVDKKKEIAKSKAGSSPIKKTLTASKAKKTADSQRSQNAVKSSRPANNSQAKGGSQIATKTVSGRSGQSAASKKSVNPAKITSKSVRSGAARTSGVTAKAKVLDKIRQMQLQRDASKDIGFRPRLIQPPGSGDPVWEKEPKKDQIGLFVRDPYWLHAVWDITRNAIERAQAALAEQWHGARPVLRLIRLDESGSSTSAEAIQAEIEIRGGLKNWYIHWNGEPASFRVSIGYLGAHGRYHGIANSNVVHTPAANSPEAVEDHWSHLGSHAERIYALSGGYDSERETNELKEMLEGRLNRSLGAPELAKLAIAADLPHRHRGDFQFEMEVEMVCYGVTEPNGYLTINEEPVTVRPDGSFVVRLPFPDRRQVIPAVAVARDGSHQRTIVVAVERNTKVMEPFDREQDSGE